MRLLFVRRNPALSVTWSGFWVRQRILLFLPCAQNECTPSPRVSQPHSTRARFHKQHPELRSLRLIRMFDEKPARRSGHRSRRSSSVSYWIEVRDKTDKGSAQLKPQRSRRIHTPRHIRGPLDKQPIQYRQHDGAQKKRRPTAVASVTIPSMVRMHSTAPMLAKRTIFQHRFRLIIGKRIQLLERHLPRAVSPRAVYRPSSSDVFRFSKPSVQTWSAAGSGIPVDSQLFRDLRAVGVSRVASS